jgi:RND family efflux transporter MFP subunit
VLKRLRDQLAFGQVQAPFDGIVTRRNINVGDLINAGGLSNPPLFAMSQLDKLHLYLYVPQDRAAQVRVGDAVDIMLPGTGSRPIVAHVTRTAGAIDQNTSTLQIDVELDNAGHLLLPGASVQATLHLQPSGTLVLPTNTLLFSKDGVQVAVVKDGKIRRQSVVLGTDYGLKVDVRSGLTSADDVVVNPPDSIATGQVVQVQAPPGAASGAAGRAAAG